MKIKLLLFLALFPIVCFSQTKEHDFFGIDLELDWYSLTNQQDLSYAAQNLNKDNKFVITDCDYIHNNIDYKFLNLRYNEMLLCFPMGHKGKLEELKPELFIARKNYSNISDYNSYSKRDIKSIKTLINEVYGVPELNMEKENFSVFRWKGDNYEIIITCKEDELSNTLLYIKK